MEIVVPHSGKLPRVQILAEMSAGAPEENFGGFYFRGYALTKCKLHLLTFKLAGFILVVYKPSAKTVKICIMFKFLAIWYMYSEDSGIWCMYNGWDSGVSLGQHISSVQDFKTRFLLYNV